jgi:cleavage and polyadenylation specificity factor subunit 1
MVDTTQFRSKIRVDPESRCAALVLPKDAIAVLPFYTTESDLDFMEQDQAFSKYVLCKLIRTRYNELISTC